MTKEQILEIELNGEELEFLGDNMGNVFDAMDIWANQELAKERERHESELTKLYEWLKDMKDYHTHFTAGTVRNIAGEVSFLLNQERERYDKLYSEFNEVCRQVQINKDRCVRYEDAYHSECEISKKLMDALWIAKTILENNEQYLPPMTFSMRTIKQSLSEYKSK